MPLEIFRNGSKYLNLSVVVIDGSLTGVFVVFCLILIVGGVFESDISLESILLIDEGRSRTTCCLKMVLSSTGSPFGVVSSILCGLKKLLSFIRLLENGF